MASLPSYREATERLDWLGLVAPYVAFSDYHSLCLVSGRFWTVFAPRLWGNLLQSARLAGLDSGDDVAWWLDFVFNKLDHVSVSTRRLVRILDSRDFAKDSYDFASDQHERTLQQSFKRALGLLPRVDSVILDGHPDLDPGFLIGSPTTNDTTCPLLLSIAHCPHQLPNTFYNSPSLQGLVYLDISDVPGSILPLLQPALLPDLRILKIRGRAVDNVTLATLASLFRLRLWSLDVSDNKISDNAIDTLLHKCFPVATLLRSPAHFRVEGKLEVEDRGTLQYGPFVSVEESAWSGSFQHPERYFVDAPTYTANPDQGPHEYQASRSDGLRAIRQDSAGATSAVLSRGDLAAEDLRISRGLTHVHLSNNHISAIGLERLIRNSSGQIESLSCDSMPLILTPSGDYSKAWPRLTNMRGILGAAHVFRPVFSSNLRVLRIHHSLVTHIPTLELEGLSTLARIHISENSILPRVDKAFAQVFAPDMNPRLVSLTLTCIPRRSSGPLITRLVAFLKLLSTQERAIQDMGSLASSWRGPGMLKGLRHLRLEFEPDAMQDGFSALEDLDAEELLNSGAQNFSFFGNEWSGSAPAVAKPRFEISDSSADNHDRHHSSYSVRNDEEYVEYRGEWNGEPFSVPVWIGKTPALSTVLEDYRRLVVTDSTRDGVGPVTPAQVLAGAPDKSYIFHQAWYMAVMPKDITAPPTSQLSEMRDVLEELKEYRLHGRSKYMELKQVNGLRPTQLGEPHFFWTGKLEVSVEEPAPYARPSQYWR